MVFLRSGWDGSRREYALFWCTPAIPYPTLEQDRARGQIELEPAEQPGGEEHGQLADAEAGSDQRLEQGRAGAGNAQRQASSTARARGGRHRLEQRRLIASRRRPDPAPAPVGERDDLAGALDG